MNIVHITHIISNMFFAFAIERFMRIFFDTQRTGRSIYVLTYLSYVVITSAVWAIFDIPILNLVSNVAALFLITLNYKSSLIKKLSAMLIIYSFMLIIDVLVGTLLGYFITSLFEQVGHSNIFASVLIALLFNLKAVLAQNFIKNMKKNTKVSKAYWISSISIPLFSIFLVILILTSETLSQTSLISAIIIIFSINVLTFYLYDSLSTSYAHKLESVLLEQEKESYYNQCELMRETIDSLHSFKHDIKIHLNTANDYIKSAKLDEASEYLTKLIGDVSVETIYSATGNIALDSIVNYKLRDAKKQGIELKIDISFPPEINIEVSDIVTIFGNLLDNAINAACKADERKLSLKVNFSKGLVTINTENTFDGEVKCENGEFISMSKDGNHGYGLKNIQDSLDKYNGYMDINYDERVFMVDALLYAKTG